MHVAARKGHVPVLEFLGMNGGDPNAVDRDKGLRPMDWAERQGHRAAVSVITKLSMLKSRVDRGLDL